MVASKCIAAGDLVIVTFVRFRPDLIAEKLGIYLDDGITNGAHSICVVLTENGIENINSSCVFPVK